MPIYEYRCKDCARHIEAQGSFTDPPLQECESCGGKLQRIFSPVGVMFKGSGFYSTDARTGAQKAERHAGNGEKRTEKTKTEEGAKPKPAEGKTPSKEAPSSSRGEKKSSKPA